MHVQCIQSLVNLLVLEHRDGPLKVVLKQLGEDGGHEAEQVAGSSARGQYHPCAEACMFNHSYDSRAHIVDDLPVSA